MLLQFFIIVHLIFFIHYCDSNGSLYHFEQIMCSLRYSECIKYCILRVRYKSIRSRLQVNSIVDYPLIQFLVFSLVQYKQHFTKKRKITRYPLGRQGILEQLQSKSIVRTSKRTNNSIRVSPMRERDRMSFACGCGQIMHWSSSLVRSRNFGITRRVASRNSILQLLSRYDL